MTDKYNTYEDETLQYYQASPNNDPVYEWDYGDTVEIPFTIYDKYQSYILRVILYNFRFEAVQTTDQNVDSAGQVYLRLTPAESSKITRGIYYCEIQALEFSDIVGAEEPEITFEETILPATTCPLYVR